VGRSYFAASELLVTYFVRNNDLSWDDLQLFLAVAERGSANAAASHFGLDQSTVSRRLKAFQSRLNAPLIQRSTTQAVLTAEARW
jgi:DNA-binding transcriptional LysR family regulator